MSPDMGPLSAGSSAPLAPILTIARNFGIGTYAVLGIFCLLVLPLGWTPMPNALLPLLLGAALITGSMVMAFRRVPLVRSAEKAAAAGGARSSLAFLQSQFIGDARRTGDWSAPGFVLVWDDRLEIDFRRESLGAGAPREQRSIRFDEISDIFAREATSMSYRKLAVLLASGEEILFTLAPRSGSGLRGPSDEETEGAVAELRVRLQRPDARTTSTKHAPDREAGVADQNRLMHVDFDQIDDPRFDLVSAEIVGGDFVLEGVVELHDERVMYDRRPVMNGPKPARRSKERWASPRSAQHRVYLVIPKALGFDIADDAGTGVLILESIETRPDHVVLTGVIPCTVRVSVGQDPRVHLFVEEHRISPTADEV